MNTNLPKIMVSYNFSDLKLLGWLKHRVIQIQNFNERLFKAPGRVIFVATFFFI